MNRRNTESIGDVIRAFLKDANLESKIFEQKLLRVWPEVLGDEMASYTASLYIRNKTLYVQLTSSVLRNELMMCRSRLVKSLNEKVGAEVINNIIFR
ncbi:MAG: DUF721 domain-containing protein [Bacteroidales bacterium]